MKIGLLGGSFDPVHNGHLNMAIQSYQEYSLDEVWLMPAGHSPNKDEEKMTPAKDRFRMCQLACEKYPFLKASDFELLIPEKSYTYRTLERLSAHYPNHEFSFIMGADSLDYFDQWVHPEIISRLARILVINRDNFTEAQLQGKIESINQLFPATIEIVHCSKKDISSSEIREKIRRGENIDEFSPEKVGAYIRQNHLYSL